MTDVFKEVEEIGRRAVCAKRDLAVTTKEQRIKALFAMADALLENEDLIISENKKDVEAGVENGMSKALCDRLMLSHDRILAMANGMREVAEQEEVLGRVLSEFERPNGLKIQKVSVPIGVIGIIFEARPNVTADAAALCLKSGNACILRGGKEAIYSNTAITKAMRGALERSGLNPDCVILIENTSRESSKALMRLNGYVDVLIPRGGRGLIRAVCDEATVPVIETGAGTCHVYVDKAANIDMAAEIIFNAKTQRPSVCNACECMLIHEAIADKALPVIAQRLREKKVEIRGDERVNKILEDSVPAKESDWGAEFLDYIIAAKVVSDIDEAIDYIAKYSTAHSECIVTDDAEAAERFMTRVDSACVYHNASTRFTDGGEFGFGAEIGISTQKLHARGPLGLAELTSYKYRIYGKGQIR